MSGSATPVPSAPSATHYFIHQQTAQQSESPAESSHDLHLGQKNSSLFFRTDSAHTLTPLRSASTAHPDHHHHDNLHDLEFEHEHELDVLAAARHYLQAREAGYRPISQRRLDLERRRPTWLRECVAEATGVFIFVICGISSIASFVLHHDHPQGLAAFGSVFQIGWAFGVGVAIAVITCAPVSGGHFNPAITLAMAFWQDFPWRKVPYYIFSQILGAFTAGLVLMACYWTKVQEVNATLIAAGRPLIGGGAPASMLCPMPNEGQSIGYLFAVEFFADAFIGLAVWAALDPANPFMSPGAVPFVIGLAYSNMIWGFGSQTLSTNLARDLGTRMVAAIFFGRDVWTHAGYAPIGMLVNIPATLLATAFYEVWIRDSFAIIGRGHARHQEGEAGLYRHMSKSGMLDEESGVRMPLAEKQH
ncbi:aquaporin-9 [Plectosphaerella cucumerina]|uniref:Aquaporin-9 n=1 Tax=Plectosphaerella cucumerina TaxID=40658 RepID=A0A8K0TAH9_9PEZI|nr:aquaporin-9 [Plectosphaerella cucumerina]